MFSVCTFLPGCLRKYWIVATATMATITNYLSTIGLGLGSVGGVGRMVKLMKGKDNNEEEE